MRRSRLFMFALLSLALVGGTAEQAQAQKDQRNLAISAVVDTSVSEKKVALVIGNSAYVKGPLKNPVNDAADIANKLRSLGFDVVERNNLKTAQIGRTLREFRAKLTNGAVALFFYAGHGLQIKGDNYLPAVDADIEGEEDVPNQSIAVRQVLELMEDAKTRLNLAFLDACRNNPYARSFRSAGEGLAKVSAPSGTLVSFATRPGSVAADGDGRNGLYTSHLLSAMDAPNQPVELMLKRVTTAVKSSSQGRQEPWMEGSIEGDFYFKTVAYSATPEAQTAQKERQQAIDRAVQEAVNAANEKAAKERAELQATMQRMIEQAMAKQSAMLEAERKLRAEEAKPAPLPMATPAPVQVATPTPTPVNPVRPVTPASAVMPTPTPVVGTVATTLMTPSASPVVVAPIKAAATVAPSPSKAPAASAPSSNASSQQLFEQASSAALTERISTEQQDAANLAALEQIANSRTNSDSASRPSGTVVAALSPSKAPAALASASGLQVKLPQPGDEWEYAAEDTFGMKSKLIWRVKAATAAGTLEELLVNDKSVVEWVFGKDVDAISAPISAGFVLGPSWSSNQISDLNVHGVGGCVSRRCTLRDIQIKPKETVSVPAGKFEALRVEASVYALPANSINAIAKIGRVSFWYAETNRRLLKQEAWMGNPAGGTRKETVELQAITER